MLQSDVFIVKIIYLLQLEKPIINIVRLSVKFYFYFYQRNNYFCYSLNLTEKRVHLHFLRLFNYYLNHISFYKVANIHKY